MKKCFPVFEPLRVRLPSKFRKRAQMSTHFFDNKSILEFKKRWILCWFRIHRKMQKNKWEKSYQRKSFRPIIFWVNFLPRFQYIRYDTHVPPIINAFSHIGTFWKLVSLTRTKRLKKRETSFMNVSSLDIHFRSGRLSYVKKGQNRCTLMQS